MDSRRRIKDRNTKKEKYRTDPIFRAKVIASTLASFAKNKDPIYRELVSLRKKLWNTRNKISILLDKVAKHECTLARLVKLKAKWEAKRK